MTLRFKYVENFFFFLLFASLIATTSFAAESDIYVVDNIAVNVVAKSPNASRSLASSTAYRDAFLVLLTRLNLATSVADNVSDDEISDMVRSEHIDNEKVAGNNYSAVFNITFAKDFVDHILDKKNGKKEDVKVEKISSENILLIPVLVSNRRAVVWEESNEWKKTIEKILMQSDKSKFVSPVADVENIAMLNMEDLAKLDYASLEPMVKRYKANSAYMLFFTFDSAVKKIIVDISYVRKMQKKQMKLSFINIEGMTQEAMMLKVAYKVLDYITKSQTNEANGMSFMPIRLQIPISSLGNYLMIKNKIENSNLVNALNIETISRDLALVNVGYVNSGVEITEAFAKIGLILEKRNDDFYVVKPNN